ncbi:MAG: MBL fold metallo-hydrolase [Planctomycetota bacterium]
MTEKIHPIDMSLGRCFVIEGEKPVLIDTGTPGSDRFIEEALQRLGVQPTDIDLIVITHGHWDHIGSVARIRERTGAKIAMHEEDKHCLEEGLKRVARGQTLWAKFLMVLTKSIMLFKTVEATKVDITVGGEGLDLSDYGIAGRILHTPGHTPGSLTVLLDSGDAFVGDMSIQGFPMSLRPGIPSFAADREQVRESWKRLFDEGAVIAHPSHGKDFPVEAIRSEVFSV